MASDIATEKQAAFGGKGMKVAITELIEEVQELYLADQIPWVVGYSGGKDSSAVLQLVWLAVSRLPVEQRTKQIHVISTDTLVEQPLVAVWVDASHAKMREAAAEQGVPLTPHKLVPDVKDTFWVNLIGRGYPKPTTQFRWCTSRMKINPSNNFIRQVVRENGEAMLVLGTRKAESQRRARNMEKHEKHRYRDRISPNAALPNSLVYSPIEDWNNDEVWQFLLQVKNPWGHTNKSLMGMYQGASADNECPVVLDTSTPSCGSSRFGCWVCTVVDKDRSMEAMIKNDDEKLWMQPLLDLRNELACDEEGLRDVELVQIGLTKKEISALGKTDKKGKPVRLSKENRGKVERNRRDFRRIDGRVQLFNGKTIPGPYRKNWREYWLKRVLEVQQGIRENGPKEMRELELISTAEMHEIRRIWLYEKHEYDDTLPDIFKQVTCEEFPVLRGDDQLLDREDWDRLKDICNADDVFFRLQTELLDIEREFRGMTRRAGIYEAIEKRLKAARFSDGEEAFAARDAEEKRAEEIRNLRTIRKDKPEDTKVSKKKTVAKKTAKASSAQQDLFDQQSIEGAE